MQSEILQRFDRNPILVPNEHKWWESKAVFNCAVMYYNKKFHMLYRAVGEYEKYISRIGYASSNDGYCFSKRSLSEEPILAPKEDYEKYGIEDPRLVEIDKQIYLSYVIPSTYAYQNPKVSTALATTSDFENFTRLGIITTRESDNKDVVLFPEKIKIAYNDDEGISSKGKTNYEQGIKYLFLHRPSSWVGPKYGVDRPSIWLGEGHSLTTSLATIIESYWRQTELYEQSKVQLHAAEDELANMKEYLNEVLKEVNSMRNKQIQ